LSHRPQRKEKNCLNCGATVAGKFCQVCGQENAEPKDTVLGLLQHFLYDITHFDGMFFRSLKLLLFKPGMLTRKYIEGKRASYLNPIKMYVFTSAIFFIIFFTFLNPVKNLYDDSAEAKKSSLEKVKHDLVTVRDSSEKSVNLEAMNSAIRETDSNIAVLGLKAEDEKKSMTDLRKKIGDSVLVRKQNFGITIDSGDLRSRATGGNGFMEGLSFSNVQAYQVYQQHLPDSLKDKMIKKAVLYRFIKMKEQGSEDRLEPVRALMERFLHAFPQLLFISLPIFAFILNMLYFRRKQYLYVDHIIFTLHLFCAIFIFILFIALFSKWGGLTGLKIFSALSSLFVLLAFFYEYKALRNFYGQGRVKTIIKFLLLNMLAGMALSLLVAALIIISAFQI
jgi:hypothetical protein